MVQDTNGIHITQGPDRTGSNTPQHDSSLHEGYYLSDKARESEIDGSEWGFATIMSWSWVPGWQGCRSFSADAAQSVGC